ncbi:hypothetical protein D9M69_687080 [compost metagenome]
MAAQLADEAGGVPGGATAQLALLQENHVPPAELGQVIGERAADDAAADDDNLRLGWKCLRHKTTSRSDGRPKGTKSQRKNKTKHYKRLHFITQE